MVRFSKTCSNLGNGGMLSLIHWAGNERWENNCAGKSPIFISMSSEIVALSYSRIEEMMIFDSEG